MITVSFCIIFRLCQNDCFIEIPLNVFRVYFVLVRVPPPWMCEEWYLPAPSVLLVVKSWLKQIVVSPLGRDGNWASFAVQLKKVVWQKRKEKKLDNFVNERPLMWQLLNSNLFFGVKNVPGMSSFCGGDPVLVGSPRHSALLLTLQDGIQLTRLWNRGKCANSGIFSKYTCINSF